VIPFIYEIAKEDYEKVRRIFAPIDYQLTIRAVIEGTCPGKVYVDDVDNPRSAFMSSAEGNYLAGEVNNNSFNAALRDLILNTIFVGDSLWVSADYMVVCIHPDTWTTKFDIIFETRPPQQLPRKYYTCTALKLEWKSQLRDGFSIKRIDQTFLENPNLEIPNHIPEWIKANWGAEEAFLTQGFGFAMVHDNQVVSWCLSDCVSGTECEIGIRTREDYRRRGLATLTTAATVDYCLSQGFTRIGWHSNEENLGSIGTAEKVGFSLTREYIWYYCMFREADHLAETGMRQFLAQQYREALENFEASFALGDVAYWFYHLAALSAASLKDNDAALRYLHKAVDHGWTHVKYTIDCEEFKHLKSTEEWQTVIKRMHEKAEQS
jgi:RimJ/RimL family protein N-acetyltransferase